MNGVSARAANLDVNTWQPRVGLAYSLTPKTVVRGGWARYSSIPVTIFSNPPALTTRPRSTASPDGNRTTYPDVIDNPFPTINTPQGASAGLLTYVGRSFSFVNTDFSLPHTDLFSVSLSGDSARAGASRSPTPAAADTTWNPPRPSMCRAAGPSATPAIRSWGTASAIAIRA